MNTTSLALAAGSILLPAIARAQTTGLPAVPGTQLPGVRVPRIIDRPLDQGIADLDQLATSLRQMPVNLHQDQGFENLWALPSNPELLYRKDAGLTAVFPASEYYSMRDHRTIALVPAGTVFYIGQPVIPAQPVPGPATAPDTTDLPRRDPASRVELLPAPDQLQAVPPAERITAQIAATPERRVITPQLAAEDPAPAPEPQETEALPEPRPDEHTMSNEAYRRLRVRNLTIRLAEAG